MRSAPILAALLSSAALAMPLAARAQQAPAEPTYAIIGFGPVYDHHWH